MRENLTQICRKCPVAHIFRDFCNFLGWTLLFGRLDDGIPIPADKALDTLGTLAHAAASIRSILHPSPVEQSSRPSELHFMLIRGGQV